MVGIQLGHSLPGDVCHGLAVGDCPGQINFNWVNARHMIDDDADRTLVRLRYSCTPLRIRQSPGKRSQAGSALFDAVCKGFSTTPHWTSYSLRSCTLRPSLVLCWL